MPALCWLFLSVGLAGAIGTAFGLLPPFSHEWWARLTTVLLWLLFAKEGYDPLAEGRAEEAAEGDDTATFAFTDALIALSELGHSDVALRLRERWFDVTPKMDVG